MPDDLRTCLEAALSEDASPATLEQHLPRIRQIVVHLLQGLKAKQGRWRAIQEATRRHAEETARASASASRDNRSSDGSVNERGAGGLDRGGSSRSARTLSATKSRDDLRRAAAAASPGGGGHMDGFRPSSTSGRPGQSSRGGSTDPGFAVDPATGAPRRGSAAGAGRSEASKRRQGSDEGPGSLKRAAATSAPSGRSSRHLGADIPPVPHNDAFSPVSTASQLPSTSTSPMPYTGPFPPVPPIPPSPPRGDMFSPPPSSSSFAANNSLEMLKKTDTLQRRASKRFSTYTYNRLTGTGVSPHKRGGPGDNSALGINLGIPGSGSGLGIAGTTSSSSLARSASTVGVRERDEDEAREVSQAGRELMRGAKSASRSHGPSKLSARDEDEASRTSTNGAARDGTPRRPPSIIPEESEDPRPEQQLEVPPPASTTPSPAASIVPIPQVFATPPSRPSATPPPEGPPVIFLQFGRDVKKAKLDTGPPTITSLRMLFMDRFQYSPGTDDFPAIYLRDPQSGVQYELEDMSEVKDRVVLSLNIDGPSFLCSFS